MNKPVSELIKNCQDNGVIVLSAGDNVLRLLPPLNISKNDINKGLNIIENCLMEF